MKPAHFFLVMCAFGCGPALYAQERHSHPAPERLGTVHFPTSCVAGVQSDFERGVALLHSFAYVAARETFLKVAERDPHCAMAHWGISMSYFYQLWEPPSGEDLRQGTTQINRAREFGNASRRERQFIDAAGAYWRDGDHLSPAVRARAYERAMAQVAQSNPADTEAQIFYALALIATAPPADRSHANQKQAAEILEPLYHDLPQHPGLAHYLIHAYDSAELASRGLAAARAYSNIAPSAPHALHMPSHIFTRLGYWDDSIASNRAARAAAHAAGDLGEELHAMDYLTYAYLQRGQDAEAGRVVADLRQMRELPAAQFKVGYAATAMPVRFVIERRQWAAAASLESLPRSAPHVAALVYWAKAIARARSGHPQEAGSDLARLDAFLSQLRSSGNAYWALQTEVLSEEAHAWLLAAQGAAEEAVSRMRIAADKEDAVEKLPVTPGPIVPAREQLGEMLLALKHPEDALRAFQAALSGAPRRRGALSGAAEAARLMGDVQAAAQFRAELIGRPGPSKH